MISKALIGIAATTTGAAIVTGLPQTAPDPRPSYELKRRPLDVLRIVRIERWEPGKAADLCRELARRFFPHPVIEDPERDSDLVRIAVDASDLVLATPLCRELARAVGRFEGRVGCRGVCLTAGAGAPSRLDWRTALPIQTATAELAAVLAEGRLTVDRGDLTGLGQELRDQIRNGTRPTRGIGQSDSLGDLALAALLVAVLFRVHERSGESGWVDVKWEGA